MQAPSNRAPLLSSASPRAAFSDDGGGSDEECASPLPRSLGEEVEVAARSGARSAPFQTPLRGADVSESQAASTRSLEESSGLPPAGSRLGFLRALFLLDALSTTTWGRFGAIYYLGKGLSMWQIGMIEGLMPLVGVVAQSTWSALADVRRARKAVYLWTSACGTCVLLLLAVPQIVEHSYVRILAISLGVRLFSSGGILDAYALEVLGPAAAPKYYGRLRLWGSVGWGCGALAMGVTNDHFGFLPNFFLYGATNFLMIALLGLSVPSDASQRQLAAQRSKKPSVRALCRLLRSPPLLYFVGELLVFGMAIGVVERLLFVYIVDDLRGDSTLCGLVTLVSSACNVPIFHYAGFLLERVGAPQLVLLSQFCYFTRVAGYTFLTHETRYAILALETLHGCTFAMLWIASVERARKLAPPGWEATLQSLLQTVYYALGPGLGALLGGYIWHVRSARFMYRAFAAAIALLFLVRAAQLTVDRCRSRRKARSALFAGSSAVVQPDDHPGDGVRYTSLADQVASVHGTPPADTGKRAHLRAQLD